MILSAGRLAWQALWRFLAHNGPDRAAAIAYYTLLSLLPLLIFVISVGMAALGSFDQAYRGSLILFQGVVVHLDPASLDALRGFVERAVRFQWPGLLLLAWTAKRSFTALFAALETIFGVPPRGFARGNLLALGMVLLTGVGLLATMAMSMVMAMLEGLVLRVAGATGAQALEGLAAGFFTHLLPVIVTFGFFHIVYRLVPGGVVPPRAAVAGAGLATLLWEGAKAGFAYYVRNLAHYAGLYGALEGLTVLALWLELSVSIVLYCGEVVALLVPAPGKPTATRA